MTENAATSAAATTRPPLTRPRDGRVIVGVCAGFGRYTDVDPVIYRVILVVLTIFGGIGAVLYGIGWLLIPSASSGDSVADRILHRLRGRRLRRVWVGIALAIIAIIALAHLGGTRNITVTVLLLGLVAYLLIRRHGAAPAVMDVAPAPAAAHAPSDAGTSASFAPTATEALPVATGSVVTTGVAAPPPHSPKRPRSPLGLITISAAAVVCGGLVLARQAGVDGITLTRILAAGLAVLGIGLLTGAWVGRARWLALPGIVLALATVTAASIDVPFTGGIGNRNWQPTTLTDLKPAYHLGIGDAVLDLSSLRVPPGTERSVEVTVAIGHIEVIVPRTLTADAHGHADVGQVDIFNRQSSGVDADLDSPLVRSNARGTVHLDLHAGLGHVEVVNG